MTAYYVFNGDADGLCGLHQLYLKEQADVNAWHDAVYITGAKRDTSLLHQIQAVENSNITVLDIEFDKNASDAANLLERGCCIRWFDHHLHQSLFQHPKLSVHIDSAPSKNTSLLVHDYIGERYPEWAIVGAFGDNLSRSAERIATNIGLNSQQVAILKECGELMNYNAYGLSLSDLHYTPLEIFSLMQPFESPFTMLEKTTFIQSLRRKYRQDLEHALAITSQFPQVYVLPNTAWGRRIIGEFANVRIRENPSLPVAVALELDEDAYMVSVRSPLSSMISAADICKRFPTGGGRVGAGGINKLPAADLEGFISQFQRHYGCNKL